MVTEHYDVITDEKTIPSFTVEEDEESDEDEDEEEEEEEEEEGDDYSLKEGEDNDGYFYEGKEYGQNAFLIKDIYIDICIFPSLQHSFILKDAEKDFDEETCQEYIHARQLGHLCSDDKEYMLLAKDKAFKSHLNNKTTKITLYHACAASCKSYVTGTLLQ